jgi:hypothetical protein
MFKYLVYRDKILGQVFARIDLTKLTKQEIKETINEADLEYVNCNSEVVNSKNECGCFRRKNN